MECPTNQSVDVSDIPTVLFFRVPCDGAEYQQLLSTLEAVSPLRRPSQLARPALGQKILSAAEGIVGEVVAIVTRAAARAATMEAEYITANLIDETGFISPSKRRRVAV